MLTKLPFTLNLILCSYFIVCSSSSYFKDITTKIPTLEILDGGHLGISMTFLEVEEHAKKLEENISKANKSESNSNIENWLSDSDKNSIL